MLETIRLTGTSGEFTKPANFTVPANLRSIRAANTMISSVIARFTTNADVITTINSIAARDGIDVGELIDGRLLPITIEASDRERTEAETRWIQDLPGVAQVDVTFVSWESDHSE